MERTREKPQADGLGATVGRLPTNEMGGGATGQIISPNGRRVKHRFMSLPDWESQWGAKRFEVVKDLYPLRFSMPVEDLHAMAERVACLVDVHDSLACYHLEAIARYRRMGTELRRMIDENGGNHDPQ